MNSVTSELKVGCFAIIVLAIVLFGYVYFIDGVRADEPYYTVSLRLPNAEGVHEGTPVKLAGVDVGDVQSVSVEGGQAELKLRVRSKYELPVDSLAELNSSGLLGEYNIKIDLGNERALIQDGGRLQFGEEPGDLDVVFRQFELISEDIKAITKVLRELAENKENTEHLEATIANVDALSLELRLLAQQNRQDINEIVDSVGRLTKNLEGIADNTGKDLDVEMDKILEATDKLDIALADIDSITGKIDRGEGTIGALVNDDATIDALNETIENANSVIEGFSGLRARVYYTGRYYVGTQPNDPAYFYGNPLAPNANGKIGTSGSNTIGIQLMPRKDFWWVFEFNDYPQGSLTETEIFYPELGYAYTEWRREQSYRFTFQMEKRSFDFSFRIGIKEGGGGAGITYFGLRDRLKVNVDVFDFAWGSYPNLDSAGLPNVRLGARWEPIRNVYLEAGSEQILLGIKHRYATGYVGGGFYFDDDDIKLLLATLPLGI